MSLSSGCGWEPAAHGWCPHRDTQGHTQVYTQVHTHVHTHTGTHRYTRIYTHTGTHTQRYTDVHTDAHTPVCDRHSAVTYPTVPCHGNRTGSRPHGPHRVVPAQPSRSGFAFLKAQARRVSPTPPAHRGPFPGSSRSSPLPAQHRASAEGLQGATPALPALGVTQGRAQREHQCLGALCPTCRDQTALCNEEPGLSPAARGLRHPPSSLSAGRGTDREEAPG